MPYMQCGHISSSVDGENNPVCALCNGIHDGYNKVAAYKWDGRTAQCNCCDNTAESSAELPFFSYKPDQEFDSYYCGCRD